MAGNNTTETDKKPSPESRPIQSLLVEEPREEVIVDVLENLVEIPRNGSRVQPGNGYDELTTEKQVLALALGQYSAWRLNRKQGSKYRPHRLTIEYLTAHTDLTEPEIRNHELLDTGVGSQYVTLDIENIDDAIRQLRRRNCVGANR